VGAWVTLRSERDFRAAVQRLCLVAGPEDHDRTGRRLSEQNGPRQKETAVDYLVGAAQRQLGPVRTVSRVLDVVGGATRGNPTLYE